MRMSSTPSIRTSGHRVTVGDFVGTLIVGLVALGYLLPLLWLADSAFRPVAEAFQFPPLILRDPLTALRHYGLDTIRSAAQEWHLGQTLRVSLLVTGVSVLLNLLVSSLCAYAFAFAEFRGKKVLFTVLLAMMMVPMGTMLVPMVRNLRVLHLTDNLLGLMLPYALSPFAVFLLRQYFIKIPRSLMEAAWVDGAGHLRIWWSVILPLSGPALIAGGVSQFLFIWNDFLMPSLVLRSEGLRTLPVQLQILANGTNVPPLDAMIVFGFVGALVPLAVFLAFQKQFIAGLSGASKG
jgi:multiple sugar transport system permease protein